jgi:hypothetical protein
MFRKRKSKYSKCMVLVLITYANSFGQAHRPYLPANSGEKIQLLSDRTLYCVSENIHFSAYYQKPSALGSEELSTVLYAELIRWDGTKLANSKVKLINDFATGFLSIPENIRSGVYYIRVYTKWMRNYSPYNYCYLPLKVINPNNQEIDRGPDKTSKEIRFEALKFSKIKEEIIISGLNSSYKRKELVEFEIDISDEDLSGHYCLSIAKAGSMDFENSSGKFKVLEVSNKEVSREYLPENKSMSISGKVLDQQTNSPLAFRQLMLSSTLDPFYFSINTSDKDGNFLFLLPDYAGAHQFCISAAGEDNIGIDFLIENDFCTKAVSLPYIPFELASKEKNLAKQICINAQLNKKFNPAAPITYNWNSFYPFYGKATEISYVKDYIELLDLREFLFELVTNVYIDKVDDKWLMKLSKAGSFSILSQLILLDNIPVQNDEKLLGLSTREIDRIEVVNGGYIIGKTMYSGIICIYSNKRDMAGMELNKSHKYFNFQLLQNELVTIPGNIEMLNQLYWDPYLEITKKKPVKVKFFTSDALGQYTLTLHSIGGKTEEAVVYQTAFTVD